MSKLFPIRADPNAPSLFTGLDLSVVGGQITALDGAASFNMTASTLTANNVPVSWAAIVDSVVNPPAPSARNLQSVLGESNTASGVDASIGLIGGVDNSIVSTLTNTGLVLDNTSGGEVAIAELSVTEISFGGAAAISGSLSKSQVLMVDTDVFGSLSATAISLNTLTDAMSMSASTLEVNASSATWADIIAVANAPPADAHTLQSVLLSSNTASGADASIALSHTGLSSLFSPSALELVGTVATTKSNLSSTVLKIEDALTFVEVNQADGLHFKNPATDVDTYYNETTAQIQVFTPGTGANTGLLASGMFSSGLFTNLSNNANYTTSQYTNNGLYSATTLNRVRCRASDGYSNIGLGTSAGTFSSLTHFQLSLTNGSGYSTLSPNAGVVEDTLSGKRLQYGANSINILNSSVSENLLLQSSNITIGAGQPENNRMTKDGMVITGTSPTENCTITTASITIASATDTSILEDTKLRIRNSDASSFADLTRAGLLVSNSSGARSVNVEQTKIFFNDAFSGGQATIKPEEVSMVSGPTSGKSTLTSAVVPKLTLENTSTLAKTEVKIGEVSSSANLSIDAAANLSLSAGADTLTFSAGSMISEITGGSTTKYLVVDINGTAYRISLLAPPP